MTDWIYIDTDDGLAELSVKCDGELPDPHIHFYINDEDVFEMGMCAAHELIVQLTEITRDVMYKVMKE